MRNLVAESKGTLTIAAPTMKSDVAESVDCPVHEILPACLTTRCLRKNDNPNRTVRKIYIFLDLPVPPFHLRQIIRLQWVVTGAVPMAASRHFVDVRLFSRTESLLLSLRQPEYYQSTHASATLSTLPKPLSCSLQTGGHKANAPVLIEELLLRDGNALPITWWTGRSSSCLISTS
jgi:hypothetical protein